MTKVAVPGIEFKIIYLLNYQGALLSSIAPLLYFWASFGCSNAIEIGM